MYSRGAPIEGNRCIVGFQPAYENLASRREITATETRHALWHLRPTGSMYSQGVRTGAPRRATCALFQEKKGFDHRLYALKPSLNFRHGD